MSAGLQWPVAGTIPALTNLDAETYPKNIPNHPESVVSIRVLDHPDLRYVWCSARRSSKFPRNCSTICKNHVVPIPKICFLEITSLQIYKKKQFHIKMRNVYIPYIYIVFYIPYCFFHKWHMSQWYHHTAPSARISAKSPRSKARPAQRKNGRRRCRGRRRAGASGERGSCRNSGVIIYI